MFIVIDLEQMLRLGDMDNFRKKITIMNIILTF